MPLTGLAPAPSWVDNGPGQGRGYDLLGLRLVAQNLSNTLLDGVTTVTPSVRYLSFKSWIAHRYAQARRPDAWKPFWDFAAGVEAAIAYGNLLNDPNRGGLLGPIKGRRLILSGSVTLPLEPLVDQLGIQIYGGPSAQLRLSDSEESNVPRLTKQRGVPIAEALADTVSDCELGRLFNAGECPDAADRTQLTKFGQLVDVSNIPETEIALLRAAILPENPLRKELPRVATYATLLSRSKSLVRMINVDDFFSAAADPDYAAPLILRPTLDGWLIYLCRDALAFSHEVVLEEVMKSLEARGGATRSVPSPEALGALVGATDEHTTALKKLRLLESGESPLDLTFREIRERVRAATNERAESSHGLRRWRGGISELDLISTARTAGLGTIALLPISWLLALERAEAESQAQASAADSLSRKGWARIGLKQVIAPAVKTFLEENWLYRNVMAELARRTVEQQLRISWTRLSQDPKRDVAVLLADGDRWSLRKRRFKAGRREWRRTGSS
jgi:hypothetical protein